MDVDTGEDGEPEKSAGGAGAAGGAGGAGGVRFIDFEYAGPNYRGAETLTIITIIGWSAG